MRAFRPAPIQGTDQDFAVAFAFPAMEFVDWHGKIIGETAQACQPCKEIIGLCHCFAKDFAFSFTGQHLRCQHESFATRY